MMSCGCANDGVSIKIVTAAVCCIYQSFFPFPTEYDLDLDCSNFAMQGIDLVINLSTAVEMRGWLFWAVGQKTHLALLIIVISIISFWKVCEFAKQGDKIEIKIIFAFLVNHPRRQNKTQTKSVMKWTDVKQHIMTREGRSDGSLKRSESSN